MTSYIELFAAAFQRPEQLGWSKVYLHGLLGDALRKNVERIALTWVRMCAVCSTLSVKVRGSRSR